MNWDYEEKLVFQMMLRKKPFQYLLLVATAALMSVLIYVIDIQAQLERLSKAEKNKQALQHQLASHQATAAKVSDIEHEMSAMRVTYGPLLIALPAQTEASGLLDEITQLGLAVGLTFRTMRWLPEKPNERYVELPLEMVVEGDYHAMGKFVGDIAALPRIVTVHDVTIQSSTVNGNGNQLMMNLTAKTYRLGPIITSEPLIEDWQDNEEDIPKNILEDILSIEKPLAYSASTLRSPFETKSSSIQEDGLHRVGTIAHKGRVWTIIRDLDGSVHRIEGSP